MDKITNFLKFLLPGAFLIGIGVTIIFFHDYMVTDLSRFVPDSLFKHMDKQVKETFGKKNCLSPHQEEIVRSVFQRLGKNRDEYSFYLIKSPEINAHAMPFKTIVFHDAILGELDSLEAFAGILAHEVAHLEKDHLKKGLVKRALLEAGTLAVFGTNSEAAIIRLLVSEKYGQSEEIEADSVAAETLDRAGIDPRPVGRFFENRKGKEGTIAKYLNLSHPAYENRIRTFSPREKSYQAMSPHDWAVLKQGCYSNL